MHISSPVYGLQMSNQVNLFGFMIRGVSILVELKLNFKPFIEVDEISFFFIYQTKFN